MTIFQMFIVIQIIVMIPTIFLGFYSHFENSKNTHHKACFITISMH